MLLIGASSVVFNAVFFSDNYGRYSGFYLDPNAAGSVCIAGYALSLGFKKSRLKTIAQFLCTFAGLITFSRTFVLIWIIVNLISLKVNPKNIKVLALGAIAIALTFSLASILNFNPIRLRQLKSLGGDEQVSVQELNEGSRTATWAEFYPYISEKPFLGYGFGSFQGGGLRRNGPHNSFLLVWGEAGIFAVLIFLGLHLYLLKKSFAVFYQKPHLFLMSISLLLFLLTTHNYFTAYTIIFYSMWIFIEAHKTEEHEN
jgi:O-antigen ligase